MFTIDVALTTAARALFETLCAVGLGALLGLAWARWTEHKDGSPDHGRLETEDD